MAQHLANLAGILQNIQMPPGVQPLNIELPPPPVLEGPLAPNDLLTQVKKHALNKVFGPESMVVYKGYVYTGQADGWVVEISPFGRTRRLARLAVPNCERSRIPGSCGRPMGIRVDPLGYLLVADAYQGIFKINPKSGRFRQLVSPRMWINKRPLGYINDLVVTQSGVIFFTSSSSKWTLAKENNIIFEGENSGRVLFYNPREERWDKQVGELVSNLSFPNGIELAKDESYLLVGEGTLSRIHRIWLGPTPPKPERIEVFASNLPGVVDNIRLSPRGTYWVGLFQCRHRGLPSVMDTFGRNPSVRGALISLMNSNVAFDDPPFGIVVELNTQGQVIRSLQDPQGKLYTGVSEVHEDPSGILFFAAPDKTFVGYMKLPPTAVTPVQPPSGSSTGTASSGGVTSRPTGSTGPVAGGGSTSAVPLPSTGSQMSQNPNVIAFLLRIRENIMRMTTQRIKQVVLELVKQLLLAKRQTLLLTRQAEAREEDLRRMREALERLQQDNASSSSSGAGTTTPASDAATTSTAGGQEGRETTAATTAGSVSEAGAGSFPTTAGSFQTAAATTGDGVSISGTTVPSTDGGSVAVETTAAAGSTPTASDSSAVAQTPATTIAADTAAAETTSAATTVNYESGIMSTDASATSESPAVDPTTDPAKAATTEAAKVSMPEETTTIGD